MNDDHRVSNIEAQERAIQSKRALLAYIRSQPKRMTMESYLCLIGILGKAGWHHPEIIGKRMESACQHSQQLSWNWRSKFKLTKTACSPKQSLVTADQQGSEGG
jgi:hypothetical protein